MRCQVARWRAGQMVAIASREPRAGFSASADIGGVHRMEQMNLYLNLVLILFFIAGNAFFVGSEIAISSARRSRIKQLSEMGDKRAARVEMLHNEPERFYSVTQVGITLVSLGLGAVGMETISTLTDSTFVTAFMLFGDSEALIKAAHTMSYVFAFIAISFLHVVAGELAPKVLAFHKAEQLSMAVGGTINILYLTFKPLIHVMKMSSNALLRLFGQSNLEGHGESHFTMSVEEIRMILSASEKDGTLAHEETQMIRGVFKLDEHTVREAMIPRTAIRALTQEDTLADALRVFRDVPHARFPICDKSLDRITGVVAIKELLTVMAESSGENLEEVSRRPVSDFARAPFIVPNSKSLSDLLKEFKRSRQQMAIVIDEYGGHRRNHHAGRHPRGNCRRVRGRIHAPGAAAEEAGRQPVRDRRVDARHRPGKPAQFPVSPG
ncbi:HlyC/CorC family transporter [Candidatus Accumulibacter phosphatis]|uniref:HlyC/CorC family transporter n=2 Tax=Candidatus Accumulibacter phosphatis TaxID=327160 RepID=A0ABX1TUG2_9PROT|nr:HlyC/CorC family transporter [Candidatus Accumulibacter phosphatis]